MKYDLHCLRCNLYLFCWGWYTCWIWQGEADSWNIRGGPSLSKVSLFVCLSNLLGIHNQWTLFSTIRLQLNLYCLSLPCFFSVVFPKPPSFFTLHSSSSCSISITLFIPYLTIMTVVMNVILLHAVIIIWEFTILENWYFTRYILCAVPLDIKVGVGVTVCCNYEGKKFEWSVDVS